MKRLLTTVGLVATAAIGLAACGLGASTGSAAPAPSASPRFGGRNGASGELVKMNGMTLVVNSQNGDVTVLYTSSTTFQRTSIGTFADIISGKCLLATGQKDAGGTVTAATARLTDKLNGACALGGGGGFGPGGGPGAPATPRPTPPAGRPNFSAVRGEVTAVTGTSITVKDSAGASQTVTVPTTVRVSKSSAAAASDLALHQCLTANGTRDSSGKVTARAISIVPPGPSGCPIVGRGFGGGGFGGGGFGGGGFGGGGGGFGGGGFGGGGFGGGGGGGGFGGGGAGGALPTQ